ncbi:MAG: hypothetical protein SR1Q7_04310 [Quinella sp. 1Q7]|nr:hypothetical protein [Quinella sp. 1Q7]
MTDIERDTERRITALESNVKSLIAEMRDFKTEIRQQNQMRANELRDLQKRQDAAQRKHEDDIREINKKIDDKFDKISGQLQTMALTTILGVGAIVWAIVSAVK